MKWTSKVVEIVQLKLDLKWSDNLFNCFDILIMNECQQIKNLKSNDSYAFRWLNCLKNILTSESFISQNFDNFRKLMSFIEIKNSAQWLNENKLQYMSLLNSNNFYKLFDNHFDVKLRIQSDYLNYYLFNNRWINVQKNKVLMKI